jgi:hypothetical protein
MDVIGSSSVGRSRLALRVGTLGMNVIKIK